MSCGTLKALLLNAGNTAGMVKGLLMLSLGPVPKDIEPDGFLMWCIYIYIYIYVYIYTHTHTHTHTPHLLYPFIYQWTFRLLPCLGYRE